MTGEFGALLRQLRHQSGMTQEELAVRAGLGVRTIRGIETGERSGSRVATVRLLADALGLGPDERDQLMAAGGADGDGGPGFGRRVRDVGPERLLAYKLPTVPYLPRDVDGELDKALAAPGVVLLVHDANAGARRTGYEALRRMLPDAVLIIDPPLRPLWEDDPSADVVVWLDKALSRDDIDRADIGELGVWLGGPTRRWVLAIVSDELMNSVQARILETLRPRVVRVSGLLSEREQRAIHERFPGMDNVRSVDAFVELAIQRQDVGPRQFGTRHAADYQADTDEGVDRLGVSTDVRMLADLVASRLIEPPLSIGLFGAWGSGKSFFMRLMRERVRSLADAARAAELAAGRRGRAVSSYCSSIRQVTFNAWHYTESNLWASLASHILDHLAANSSESDLRRRADDLAESRRAEESLLGQLSAVRMERMLLTAQQEQRAARGRRPAAVAGALLRGLSSEDRSWIAAELGVPEPSVADVRRFAEETIGLSTETRGLVRRLRRDPLPGMVLLVGIVVVGVLAALIGWTGWTGLAGGVALIGTLATAVGRVRAAVSRIRKVADKLDVPDRQAAETASRLAELDGEAERLERAIADMAPGHHIAAFAEARSGSQDYRQHLGVVSLLRRDLETFAAMLARERDRSSGAAGIERIVLYIDDLDRCPPRVVIQVLEAIHLMLALPVFTVVVGVDARWLTHAIRQHYATMLDGAPMHPADGEALAAHYLEKIFQIPLVLRPMGDEAFAEFVHGLAAPDGPGPEHDPALTKVANGLPPGDGAAAIPRPTDQSTPPATRPAMQDPTDALQPAANSLAPLDLLPRRLATSSAELAFVAMLGSLVSTPRAAKRLINLYRLLRARFQGADLDEFLDAGSRETPHRAVLLLLAVLVGHPDRARSWFDSISEAAPDGTLQALLDRSDGDPVLGGTVAALNITELAPPELIGSYQRWLPLVRRFYVPTI